MKHIIGKFFAAIRQCIFAARIRREIYGKIFPHLRQEADHGYPFNSDEQIVERNMTAFLTTGSMVRLIEQAASKMPQSEGDAFRHIAYRDLQAQMWRYVEFAKERIQPKRCDAQFVAAPAAA